MSPEVWVIYHDHAAYRTKAARQSIRQACAARGWGFQDRGVPVEKWNGVPTGFLKSQLAAHIYERMHRVPLAVVHFGQTLVCLHPDDAHSLKRGFVTGLSHFSKYKSFVVRLAPAPTQPASWMHAFDRWSSLQSCEGHDDPRVLPLHVFEWRSAQALSRPEGRAHFRDVCGTGTQRTDLGGRLWGLNLNALHGTDILCVSGLTLPRGFHWDVEPGGDSTTVMTPREVWRVLRYVNVSPNARVRGRAPWAKRLIPQVAK